MPIYNGNGARQEAHRSLFVHRQGDEMRGEKLIIFDQAAAGQ